MKCGQIFWVYGQTEQGILSWPIYGLAVASLSIKFMNIVPCSVHFLLAVLHCRLLFRNIEIFCQGPGKDPQGNQLLDLSLNL
jgi:hypothetical protein